MFEIVAGELRAKLGLASAMPQARAEHDTRAVGHGRGARGRRRCPWAAAEPGGGARGRWRGLAGLRDDAPSKARGADGSRAGRRPRAQPAARPHWCGGRRRDRRARAGFEIDHSEPQARVWRSRGRPGPPAPGTPAEPQTQTQTQTRQSGPEPLGSGPPSMLSGDQQRATRVSSARPPCRPCRSSRR